MKVGTKEFDEILSSFDREFKDRRLEKEEKKLWKMGVVYQDGEVNALYLAYRLGYALGRCKYLIGGSE